MEQKFVYLPVLHLTNGPSKILIRAQCIEYMSEPYNNDGSVTVVCLRSKTCVHIKVPFKQLSEEFKRGFANCPQYQELG